MRLVEGDTLIYSARPIPGNEASIWRTINRLFRMGVNVIYDSVTPVHVSGHAYQEELKMMINLTRPFYLAPVHGEPRHQHTYNDIARGMDYPEHRIFTLRDGEPLCLDSTNAWIGETIAVGRVLVDAAGQVGVTPDVLRDRTSLSRDGIVTIAVAIDLERGELVGEPIVGAKGFHAAEEVLTALGQTVGDHVAGLDENSLRDADRVRHEVGDLSRRFLNKRTGLRPLVLPMIVEV